MGTCVHADHERVSVSVSVEDFYAEVDEMKHECL